jgi:hypothetical protein
VIATAISVIRLLFRACMTSVIGTAPRPLDRNV